MPERPQPFTAARADILDVDIGLVIEIVQIGDFLCGGGKARCQHQIKTTCQIFVIVAVLIHDRQPFDPLCPAPDSDT